MNERGRAVLDLAPGPDNPRNSEGDFINLNDGRIMFVYSRFRGDVGHDDSPSDIAAIHSADGGLTWTEPEILFRSEDHNATNIMSVTLLRMQNDDIGLFYGVRAGANDTRIHLRRSSDEGATWSTATVCIQPAGYFVVNNDRIVRLSTGRLVIPAAFHRNGYDSYNKNRTVRFDGRGVDVFFVSDDDGVTWTEAHAKCAIPYSRNCTSGLQEPGITELSNGVLWAYARTNLGVQYEMFSLDGAQSWTGPEPSRFTSPQSPLSVKRVPTSGKLVAVWNPIPNYNGRSEREKGVRPSGRTPLVMAFSEDEGRTWSDLTTLEDEPDHGYCYTAIHFTDDAMLLGYCAGGVEDHGCLNRLRIRRIPLAAL